MNLEQQKALLELQNQGYTILFNGGYVNQIGTGRIFEATEQWIKNETRYYSDRNWAVGELVYKDSTYTGIALSTVSLYEFRLYKTFDIEKKVNELIKRSEKQK